MFQQEADEILEYFCQKIEETLSNTLETDDFDVTYSVIFYIFL